MPIFHDIQSLSKSSELPLAGRDDADCCSPMDSIQTECPVSPLFLGQTMAALATAQAVNATSKGHSVGITDRVELMERIKRGESPTWIPNKTLETYFQTNGDPPQGRCQDYYRNRGKLMPPAELKDNFQHAPKGHDKTSSESQRTRSALHAGDFLQEPRMDSPAGKIYKPSQPPLAHLDIPLKSPQPGDTWPPTPSPTGPGTLCFDFLTYPSNITESLPRPPSLTSYSSSFVLKPPTSPLAQASTNSDLELSPNLLPKSRRHTLPPHASSSFRSSPPHSGAGLKMRREPSFPYQAHQPRRSLSSSFNFQPTASLQTPAALRSRRPSLSSDFSPLQRAPMVGSYEESILRGRMSTVPSRPLNFLAQIGVLGLGKCSSSLKCPAHVSIPFPAVFYSYGSEATGTVDDSPSPYVGLIDIEDGIKKPTLNRDKKMKKRENPLSEQNDYDCIFREETDSYPRTLSNQEIRRREKKSRRSQSPKAPPGGSYRIPQKGQLQIVIKNPNKTAVKLFLVPYDLEDMEPGSKTFIRQRSYSTGPIIESPADSINFTSSPEHSKDRPHLRYLIHLNICCPSRGNYFLYKGIRVVFANRVPDGKEKLQNEIHLPSPRYSSYKPARDTTFGGHNAASERSYKRRSSGIGLTSTALDTLDGISLPIHTGTSEGRFHPDHILQETTPTQEMPFGLAHLFGRTQAQKCIIVHDNFIKLPVSPKMDLSPKSNNSLPRPDGSPEAFGLCDGPPGSIERYAKLTRDDTGYGGPPFAFLNINATQTSTSLLARRLKGLGVESNSDNFSGAANNSF
ncbi:MAG: hypothetical protein M1829_005509 [Trizodia sp. TS-e1964]|nr:MAG: hypothetical protein M1829_005509 [Trizodia sp. TS-e1964]